MPVVEVQLVKEAPERERDAVPERLAYIAPPEALAVQDEKEQQERVRDLPVGMLR